MDVVSDVLHASHLPELIKKHYGVDHITFETNYMGMHILTNNPFIDELQFIDVSKMTYNRMLKNLEWARYEYDLVFDFSNTIEKAYCLNENDWRYYTNQSWRRETFGKKSYYDVMTDAAGLPSSYYGTRGKLYYSDEDHIKAKEAMDKRRQANSPIILINLSGSTLHKKFIQAEEVTHRLLKAYPNCLIILTGDSYCKEQIFEHERILSWVDNKKKGFRSVSLDCKYVDLTISLESGLPLVAHSWDAPCLQLLTAASPENHCKYAKNAYWIQSPISCSPCHKNPREYFGCPITKDHPSCIYFDTDEIILKAEKILGSC